jgi:general secretion pathway protein L
MLQRLSMFPLSARPGRLSGLVEPFGQWWLREFLDLFPQHIADWLAGRNRNTVILAPEPDSVTLHHLNGGRQQLASTRFSRSIYSPAAIDEFLRSRSLQRKDVEIGVRLPAEQFFARSLVLPIETAASLDQIVLQDLTRKTPFRLEDIHHDYSHSVSDDNKIAVRQWIIRNDLVQDIVGHLQLDLGDVAFLEGEGEMGGALRPFIAVRRRDGHRRRAWLQKALLALSLSAMLLAAAVAVSTYWRQQRLIDDLAIQITAARSKAQQVRSNLDKLERDQSILAHLRSRRTDAPRLLDIWDEATRVLPTHSWLTELRVSEAPQKQEQQIVLTGFSAEASSLVRLIVQSPIFFNASLTAPISIDPLEGRERFVLQANVRRSRQVNVP